MQESGQLDFRFEFCILVAGFVSRSCPEHVARLTELLDQQACKERAAFPV
jgi:hypothetical protein